MSSDTAEERPAPRMPKRAILLPGNGIPPTMTTLDDCCFYSGARAVLAVYGIALPLPALPDGYVGHENIWKPFVVDELKLDEDTILIGHSTGAVCAMRLMEEHRTAGCVLVSAYTSDLGDEMERESGYFSRPWDYAAMKRNTPWILQFHSENDPLVPISEGNTVAQETRSKYVVSKNEGHFNYGDSETIAKALAAQLEELGCEKRAKTGAR